MANQYKAEKEAFVSNLHGGAISEINLVTAVGPASIFLWSVLQSRLGIFNDYDPIVAISDFQLVCAAVVYSTTILASNAIQLLFMLLLPAILFLAIYPPKSSATDKARRPVKKTSNAVPDALDSLPVKPFLTSYRGWMMVITCVSILAVDFRAFPRRFAKVENWGTSLMDLGVGSFVFSTGVVAARPILKQRSSKALSERLLSSARHSLPLFILGLIRLYSVKGLDYAEHVTEYGVHWNFFFTLAFISPFVALFDALFRLLPSYGVFALVVAVVYQVLLDSTDLTAFIVSAPRVDLISKNREGICSLFGYLAVFLAGQGTGTYILPRYQRTANPLNHALLRKLALWSAIWCGLFFLATNYTVGAGLSVSRRLANLPYVLWINAFNCVQLLLLCVMEMALFPNIYNGPDTATERRRGTESCSRLLRAFNRNGLAVFLLANLLTGLVNLTLPTLHMSDLQAVGVLLAYMGTLSAVALVLDWRDISIKL